MSTRAVVGSGRDNTGAVAAAPSARSIRQLPPSRIDSIATGRAFSGFLDVRLGGAWVSRYIVLLTPRVSDTSSSSSSSSSIDSSESCSRLFAFGSAATAAGDDDDHDDITEIFPMTAESATVSFEADAPRCYYVRICSLTADRTWLLRTSDRALAEKLYYVLLTLIPFDRSESSTSPMIAPGSTPTIKRRSPPDEAIFDLLQTYVAADQSLIRLDHLDSFAPPQSLDRRDSAYQSMSSTASRRRSDAEDFLTVDRGAFGGHSQYGGRSRSVSPCRNPPAMSRSGSSNRGATAAAVVYGPRLSSLADLRRAEQELTRARQMQRPTIRGSKSMDVARANVLASSKKRVETDNIFAQGVGGGHSKRTFTRFLRIRK